VSEWAWTLLDAIVGAWFAIGGWLLAEWVNRRAARRELQRELDRMLVRPAWMRGWNAEEGREETDAEFAARIKATK